MKTPNALTLLVLSTISFVSGNALAAPTLIVKQPHIEAELVAGQSAARAGEATRVAVRLKPDSGWHVYWRNPGDSGEPVKVSWRLPEGVEAGPLQWPAPQRIVVGPLVNFGYEGEIFLASDLMVPKGRAAGENLFLHADVKWLVCQDVCVPGKAALDLALPVTEANVVDSKWHEALVKTAKAVPAAATDLTAKAEMAGDSIVLHVKGAARDLSNATYFPYSENVIQNAAPQNFKAEGEGAFSLTIAKSNRFDPKSEPLDGVLEIASTPPVSVVVAPQLNAPAAAGSGASGFASPTEATGSATTGLWQALLFAFLGGMILNLMPCVFPVLFIKILNFVEMAGASRRKAVMHSVAYTAGILICFWSLAGALLVLRASGQQLGWGFQLQSPVFLSLLCLLLTAMALNLGGLFEVGTSFMGVGQNLAMKAGYSGSFFSGVLAVVVATPCTAPFMGTAMGFALVHSPVISFAVFTALALGLATPYLILSANPRLTKKLPRPGAWMETFKQLMAFPLLATVIWLLSVLGVQTDLMQLTKVLVAMLILSLGLWLYGKRLKFPRLQNALALLLVIGAVYCSSWGGTQGLKQSGTRTATSEAGWTDYSDAVLEKAQASGRPVFIDFTAAWCITCQVNKRVALDTEKVRKKFAEKNVFLIVADWTNQNAEISKRLESYGRDGVPLYVLYRAGQKDNPEILPQILTPEGVVQALDKL